MGPKTLGFLGIVAVLAAFLAPGASGPSTAIGAPSEGSLGGSLPADAPGACKEDEGPWRAAAEDSAPGECSANQETGDFSCVPKPPGKVPKPPGKFLVAAVPDPEKTHLALYSDQTIESLNWAISDDDYTLGHYWLPWTAPSSKDLFLLADRQCREKLNEERRKQPGLMIFHGNDGSILWVFLVGETPTSGMNKDELWKAVQYIRGNCPAAESIDMIGPSFSGSLAPLASDWNHWFPTNPPHLHLVSGMVTSSTSISAFRKALPLANYESLVEGDDRATSLLFHYVTELWSLGQGPARVAVLSEEETAYGRELKPPDAYPVGWLRHNWLTFRYPREISRLRNAYQEEAGTTPADAKGATSPGLRFTLKDEGLGSGSTSNQDNIAAFSPVQSPASQEAALSAIATTLREEHIDFAGIVATDVLDSLFLSRFLRTSAPDIRLFTLDANLMFVREQTSTPLKGMLSITNYPLISLNQHWTDLMDRDQRTQSRVQFPSRAAQGVYNATRGCFRDRKPSSLNMAGLDRKTGSLNMAGLGRPIASSLHFG